MTKKIIIIDDEIEILKVLETFLKRSEKFEITTFLEPRKGLQDLKSNKYDLILLDIMMPDMSGMDVLAEIKNIQPEMKTIMMTAYSTIEKVIECKRLGADDYVTKPFVSLRDVENKILDNLGL